jgi:uncharacterized protein YcfJ
VGAARPTQAMKSMALVAMLVLGLTSGAEAQVGIRSGVAQLTLVARSAPQASIRTIEPIRHTARARGIIEASTTIGLSANSGYRLVVRSTGSATSRIWVLDANGVYQELTGTSSVTVAGDVRGGQLESQVRYRVEAPERGELADPLPVRYEIAINPTL